MKSLDSADLVEVLRFVKQFIPLPRQPRWRAVLTAEPSRWSRLSMDDLFNVAQDRGLVRPTDIEDALKTSDLISNPEATLYRFSAEPYLLRGPVRDLVDELVDDDAIISVNGGRVFLACHHSSGWVVCRS